jgi:hypothetical protein
MIVASDTGSDFWIIRDQENGGRHDGKTVVHALYKQLA